MASSFSSPWPDPNSQILSKINFGVPLVELVKWLDVRDTLLGKQNITAALALARDCKHPDAEWLTSIFEGKDVSTKEGAREMFLSFENDARALCFAWHLKDARVYDLTLLRLASEMGNAFACSTLCEQVWRANGEEAFRMARYAASLYERDGFYQLGFCFYSGIGCEQDLNLAKENFLIAAELGDAGAADYYGMMLNESDPARWLWWGRAAVGGLPYSCLDNFWSEVKNFFSGSGNATVVFLIGLALKGSIDMEKKEIFGEYCSDIGLANQAVSFYYYQVKASRLAVDTWSLISTRMHLIRDMRIYIGKLIWDAKFEANYRVDLGNDASSSSSSFSSSSPAFSPSVSSSLASSPVLERSGK